MTFPRMRTSIRTLTVYKRLKDLVDEGNINDAENLLTDELDTDSLDCLEMALTFYTVTSTS